MYKNKSPETEKTPLPPLGKPPGANDSKISLTKKNKILIKYKNKNSTIRANYKLYNKSIYRVVLTRPHMDTTVTFQEFKDRSAEIQPLPIFVDKVKPSISMLVLNFLNDNESLFYTSLYDKFTHHRYYPEHFYPSARATFSGSVCDIKCKCKGLPGKHIPVPLSEDIAVHEAKNHCLQIVDSLQVNNSDKVYDIIKMAVSHCLINPFDVLRPDDEEIAMWYHRAIAAGYSASHPFALECLKKSPDLEAYSAPLTYAEILGVQQAIPRMDFVKDMLNTPGSMVKLAEAVAGISNSGVNVNLCTPDTVKIEHNIPGLSEFNSNFKDGVKVDINVPFIDKIFTAVTSAFSPLGDLIEYLKNCDPRIKQMILLIVVASIEVIRSTKKMTNMWSCSLAAVNIGLATLYGETHVKSIVFGFYTGVVIAKIVNYFSSQDEDEPVITEAHFETQDCKRILPSFFNAAVTIMTGITSVLCIREIASGLTLYKTLMNGASFAIDSIANVLMDLINFLGSPFGVKIFRKAYGRYPILFDIVDHLNKLKDKVTANQEVTVDEVKTYQRMKQDLRSLEITIPINSENAVYRNALNHLNKMFDTLDDLLKSTGFLDDFKRTAPYTVTYIGCSASCKTDIAKKVCDIIVYQREGADKLAYYKSMPNAFYYSFKSGKKHHDGFSPTTKFVFMDDLGQIRKTTEPANCPWVMLVFMGNNERYCLEMASLGKKDAIPYAPTMQFITSNMNVYQPDNSHCVEGEAPIRRCETNNNCVFAIVLKEKWRTNVKGGAWGYAGNEALKQKDRFDPDAFDVVPWDLRTGSPHPTIKKQTWVEHLQYVDLKSAEWEVKEAARMKNQATDYLDPAINPFLPKNVDAHMETECNYSAFQEPMDFKDMSREDMLKLLVMKENKKKIPKAPNIDDFPNIAEFIEASLTYYEAKVDCFDARGGKSCFDAYSRVLWGLLGDEEWARLMHSRAQARQKIIEHTRSKIEGVFISSASLQYTNSYFEFETMRAFAYGLMDIYYKFKNLAILYGKSIMWALDLVETHGLSFAFSTKEFNNLVKCLAVNYWDSIWTVFNVFSINNIWFIVADVAINVVVGYLTTIEAVAHADYQRAGKVLRDPLQAKCKETKVRKAVCSCIGCGDLRKSLKPVVTDPKSAFFNQNDEDKAEGVSKRNVWSMSVHEHAESPVLAVNNITMYNSFIGETQHHFYMYIVTEILPKYPVAIVRFHNWNDTRHFDVLFKSMIWDNKPDLDKAFWINKNLSSFGGGIRNITNFLISIDDPVPRIAELVLLRHDKITGETTWRMESGKVDRAHVQYSVNQGYMYGAFSIDVVSVFGNCGAPMWTADPSIKPSKIMGLIASGSKDNGKFTYVSPTFKEEVLILIRKHDLVIFDTSLLPLDVVETELVPEGCVVARFEADDHSIATNNPLKKTPFFNCCGPISKIPTFVAPWRRHDNEIFDPLDLSRKKAITHGPAIHPDLYMMAATMQGINISTYLGPGPRAFRLSTMEAIEGKYGEARFSTRTSPGGKYILEGISKKDIVKLVGDELDFSQPQGARFLKDIENRTKERELGIVSLSYTNEFGKSEVLLKEKVQEGKARLVQGGDADVCIADKKELACISYLLKQLPISSGVCIGKDPLSDEFNVAAKLLLIWNNIVPGDHSGFDTNFFYYKFMALLITLRIILHDVTPKHWIAIMTCIQGIINTIHIAHITFDVKKMAGVKLRVFYEMLHGMISGSYPTLIFNTMGHGNDIRYIMLCAYVENVIGVPYLQYDVNVHGVLPIMDIERQFIAIITGDDILLSVSPHLKYINFYNIKQLFAKHNSKFTTDKKDESEDVPYCSIVRYSEKPNDFTFCKRSPLYNHRFSRYVWALDLESIFKSLYYSEDFSEYEQIIDTAFRELVVHGRSTFLLYKSSICEIALRFFNYISPLSVFELAELSVFGGKPKNTLMKVYLDILEGVIEEEDLEFLTAVEVEMYLFSL